PPTATLLSLHDALPIYLRPGVEGVDHHLAVDGAGDLHPAVAQVLGRLRHLPGLLADVSGLGEESGHQADVELGLALPSHGEEERSEEHTSELQSRENLV